MPAGNRAELLGQIHAGEVPLVVAAGRAEFTDLTAAGGVIAPWGLMHDVAGFIGGIAASVAQIQGDVDAYLIPLAVTAHGIGQADLFAADRIFAADILGSFITAAGVRSAAWFAGAEKGQKQAQITSVDHAVVVEIATADLVPSSCLLYTSPSPRD